MGLITFLVAEDEQKILEHWEGQVYLGSYSACSDWEAFGAVLRLRNFLRRSESRVSDDQRVFLQRWEV